MGRQMEAGCSSLRTKVCSITVCTCILVLESKECTVHAGSEEAPHVIASQALPLNKDSYQQARTRSLTVCMDITPTTPSSHARRASRAIFMLISS